MARLCSLVSLLFGLSLGMGLLMAWPTEASVPTATLRADYQFPNTLDSSVAGAPPLSNLGPNSFGTTTVDGLSRTVLTFARNDGLSLSTAGLVPNGNYTIVILFAFDDVSSWRRILDFKSASADTGLYSFDSHLNFYNEAIGPDASITAGTFVQVVLTRDSAANVVGYVDGQQQFSFGDSITNVAVIDSNALLRFFRDEDPVFPNEASAGSIARLRLYDAALSSSEVAMLDRLPGGTPPSTIQFSPVAYSSSEDAGLVSLSVTRSGATNSAASVQWSVIGGTATVGDDYAGSGGTLSFAPGEILQDIAITILEDALVEGDETVNLALSNPDGVTLGTRRSATLTIFDNDTNPPPAMIQFELFGNDVGEAAGVATIGVTRTGDTTGFATVDYFTSDFTATAPDDYTNVFGTLSFGPGQSANAFTIPIADDVLAEGDEIVFLYLSNPVGAELGSPASADLIIVDDDAAGSTIQFSTAPGFAVDEGAGSATLTITRTGDLSQPASVQFQTSAASATGDEDYAAISSQSLTFLAGQTQTNVAVPIIDDAMAENDEVFYGVLAFPVGAALGNPSFVSVTIQDNDSSPALRLNPLANYVIHAGVAVRFVATVMSPAPPAQLAFSLEPGAPVGAAIHPQTGQFTWTTSTNEAGQRFQISVRVTDNNTPPATDARTFTVVVLREPTFTDIGYDGTNVVLKWSAIPGTVYQVFYASNTIGPWFDLPPDVTATNTIACKIDYTITNSSTRFYRIVTRLTNDIPIFDQFPFCVVTKDIKPGAGIRVDVVSPAAGNSTASANAPIPLIVSAADEDQLRQECVCVDLGDFCTSTSLIAVTDPVSYRWSILAGGGALDGRIIEEGGVQRTLPVDPATLFRPPRIEIGESKEFRIQVEIRDSRNNDRLAKVTFTITIRREEDCRYVRTVAITPETDPGQPLTVTPTDCDCQPQPPTWRAVPNALTGQADGEAPNRVPVCAGERVLLLAEASDRDELEITCDSEHCDKDTDRVSLADEVVYEWTATRGSFPEYGGGRTATSRGFRAGVIYLAPDTPGQDTIRLVIRDSGRQAADQSLEKQVRIDVRKVDLTVSGLGEADEECEGAYLCLNEDDDNNDKTLDVLQSPVTGENDLLRVTTSVDPNFGEVSLKINRYTGQGSIGVYEDAEKRRPANPKYRSFLLPRELYIEGRGLSSEPRDVELELQYADLIPECKDVIRFTVVMADLDGDRDYDGTVEANAEDEANEDALPGIIGLCNVDDDDRNGTKDNQGGDAANINNGPTRNDHADFAPLVIRRMPVLPAGWSVELSLHTPGNIRAGTGAGDVVRVFADYNGANPTVILGPGTTRFVLPVNAAHNVDLAHLRAGDITNLGFEGLEFAGEVKLRLELKRPGGAVVCSDQLQLKVSPLILIGHHRAVRRSLVSQITHGASGMPLSAASAAESTAFCTARFPGATPGGVTDEIIPPDRNGRDDQWAQDEFQIGFQDAPYGRWHVVLDSKRDGGLRAFPPERSSATPPGLLGPDFGHIQISDGTAATDLDSFGNLEVTPPCRVAGRNYRFGRIYYGDNAGPGGRRIDSELRAFFARQAVQNPVAFNSDWLIVGHVDEFMSILMDGTGTHGWKVLLADSQLGVRVLAGGGGQPGVDGALHIPRYTDYGATLDRVSRLLARGLNAPLPGAGSKNIRDYNLREVNAILFGPPAAARAGGLKGDIQTAFGLADGDFIYGPVLFNRRTEGGMTKATAITPDIVNGAVYPGIFIAPDNFLHVYAAGAVEEDGNMNFRLNGGEDANGNGLLDSLRDPFHVYLNGVLPGGVTARYIDDWRTYHRGDGEVHCGSNDEREIPTERWWQ